MSKVNWLFGLLKKHGVDIDGMSLNDAFAKLEELRKAGEIKESEVKFDAGDPTKASAAKGEGGKKKTLTKRVVKVDMEAEVQKQLGAAETPKERREIAFNYIKANLRNEYSDSNGRTVDISLLGAKEFVRRGDIQKFRVTPHLAEMIQCGKLETVDDAIKPDGTPHKHFKYFAYYKVSFQIGKDSFTGFLNVGIRSNGSATLYDLNPYNKN